MKKYNGAFLLSRTIFESHIFSLKPSAWFKIWVFIIGKVSFQENNLTQRGEGLFSYTQIQSACKVSRGQVDKCLKYLKKRKKVETRRSTRQFFIKVLNYDKYQDIGTYKVDESVDRGAIDGRQRSDRESTGYKKKVINNNLKNNNKPITVKPEKSSISRMSDLGKKKSFSQESLKLAHLFFTFGGERFLALCPQFSEQPKKLLDSWTKEIEKLHRIDGLDFSQIEFLINYLFTSDNPQAQFWRNQIISPAKFRKKNKDGSVYWRVLVDQMRQEADRQDFEEQTFSL